MADTDFTQQSTKGTQTGPALRPSSSSFNRKSPRGKDATDQPAPNAETAIDNEQIETLFQELCDINRQIVILAEEISVGDLPPDAAASIKILAGVAGMYADMGLQKFGPGALGGADEWLYPDVLKS